jgi:hypothetical protein
MYIYIYICIYTTHLNDHVFEIGLYLIAGRLGIMIQSLSKFFDAFLEASCDFDPVTMLQAQALCVRLLEEGKYKLTWTLSRCCKHKHYVSGYLRRVNTKLTWTLSRCCKHKHYVSGYLRRVNTKLTWTLSRCCKHHGGSISRASTSGIYISYKNIIQTLFSITQGSRSN